MVFAEAKMLRWICSTITSLVRLKGTTISKLTFWWNQHAILDYVMGRSLETFKRRLRLAVNETLCAKEGRKETVRRAFSVPRCVSDAKGGADSLVLDNIVHHASPDLMNVMRAKYDPTRAD